MENNLDKSFLKLCTTKKTQKRSLKLIEDTFVKIQKSAYVFEKEISSRLRSELSASSVTEMGYLMDASFIKNLI